MKTTTLQPIFAHLRTKLDLESLIADISLLQNSTFLTEGDSLQKSLQTKISSINAKLIEDAMREENISLLDKPNAQKLLGELLIELKGVSDITIVLSFEPTLGIIEKVSLWIKNNVSQKAILHFRQDATIIGGIVVIFEGQYKDYSLKLKVDEYIKTNQEVYKKYLE